MAFCHPPCVTGNFCELFVPFTFVFFFLLLMLIHFYFIFFFYKTNVFNPTISTVRAVCVYCVLCCHSTVSAYVIAKCSVLLLCMPLLCVCVGQLFTVSTCCVYVLFVVVPSLFFFFLFFLLFF